MYTKNYSPYKLVPIKILHIFTVQQLRYLHLQGLCNTQKHRQAWNPLAVFYFAQILGRNRHLNSKICLVNTFYLAIISDFRTHFAIHKLRHIIYHLKTPFIILCHQEYFLA